MPPTVATIEADLETRLLEYTYQVHLGDFPITRYEGFGDFEVAEFAIRDSTNSQFESAKYRLQLILVKKRPLGQPRPKPTFHLRLLSIGPNLLVKCSRLGKKADIKFFIWCVMGDFAERGASRELRPNELFFLSDVKPDAKARVIFNLKIVLPVSHPSLVSRANKLEENVRNLRDSGIFADCTIVTSTDGQAFPAHKCFLALKSPVFQSAFESPMKEGTDSILSLPCDKELGAALLDYIYLDKMPSVTEENAVDLLGIGHVYQMEVLLDYVAEQILDLISPTNVLQFVILAERYQLELVESTAIVLMAKNIDEVMCQPDWSEFRGGNHPLMDKLLKALAAQIPADGI